MHGISIALHSNTLRLFSTGIPTYAFSPVTSDITVNEAPMRIKIQPPKERYKHFLGG